MSKAFKEWTTFKKWFEENKEGSLKDDYNEYKENSKIEGMPRCEIMTFRKFARERFDSINE
ncbi:MAG: hypothetical protein AABY15_06830 [Nanoarchaeota archaeon]